MHIRMAVMLLGAGTLLGCEGADVREAETQPGAVPAAEIGSAAAADVFVEGVPGDAQLLYVAREDTRPEDARAGAVFVPMSTFSVERDGIPNEFPPADSMAAQLEAAGVRGERFVIAGEPIPAARAWAALDYLGLADGAALLDGGPEALSSAPADQAATRDAADDEAGLDIDVREDMIVDAGWVRERLDDEGVVLLDARPPAEYSGDTPGEGVDRPGHIPGARNLFWQDLVESADAPRLRDEAELRRLFEEAGVGPGDTVVAYCRTGGQASFLYAVARHLGYETRLYDGSFVDWSRTEYPVERGADAGATAGSSGG